MKELYCKTPKLFYIRMIVLPLFFIVFICTVSCGNSVRKSKAGDNAPLESAIVNMDDLSQIRKGTKNIPITINLTHTEDEDLRQLVDAEYEITFETEKDIYIDINSGYYKRYTSGTRFKTEKLAVFEKSENVEYLTVCLDVVNNTNERVSVQELDLNIIESKPDTIPLIYICTTEDQSNSIYFVNESWFDWTGFTFSYSLLKNGEPFNGHYRNSRHIPYFSSYTIINLLPDMKSMGYDFDGLIESLHAPYYAYVTNDEASSDEEINYVQFSITEDDEDFLYFQNKFSPFGLKKDHFGEYVGFATLYGSVKFDDVDFEVDFIAEISLSTSAGFGAVSYENDRFDVKLKSSGSDYMLRYPYTTVIEPYGAEMIKLSVVADKSSSHKFYVDIKNDNGLSIRSKDIYFHYYFPQN